MNFALVALFAGATCIALSPIWVRLADVGPTASAFWRVALAVPLLWILHAAASKVAPGRALATLATPAHSSGEPMLPQSGGGWLVLLGLAWVSHSADQGLIAYALAHPPAAFSTVSLLFQPVMAGVFACLLPGEPLVALQVAGGAVVLAGFWLARRGSKQDTPVHPAPLRSRAEP